VEATNKDIDVASRTIIINEIFKSISNSFFFGSILIEISQVINPKDNRFLNGFRIDTYDNLQRSFLIDNSPDNILIPGT
jgi:hypothetical protein